MDLNEKLISELRRRALAEESPCALAELIGERLGHPGTSGRMTAIVYFRAAFLLGLHDAMLVGAAPVFEPGLRDPEELDAELTELINKHRDEWERALESTGWF